MSLSPYVTFDGNCADAMDYYKAHLGAQEQFTMHYRDAPEGTPWGPAQADKVMHAQLRFGEQVLMLSDTAHYQAPAGVLVSLDAPTPAEAERMFAALADGGHVRMPMAATFWAERFGMVTDRFGVPWMIDCPKRES